MLCDFLIFQTQSAALAGLLAAQTLDMILKAPLADISAALAAGTINPREDAVVAQALDIKIAQSKMFLAHADELRRKTSRSFRVGSRLSHKLRR